MKVLLTELKKLFSNKIFLMIIVSVFVLNAYLVFRTANYGEATPADYKMIYSEIDGLSDTNKLAWFNERTNDFTGQYRYNWNLMYELQEDCDNVVNYSEYLENIKSQADSMTSVSIFAKPDTFNYRSIVRTPPAYENVQNVKPVFDMSQGIVSATDNNFTDVFCGFVILFATLIIMIADREQGLSGLLFSLKRGRSYLIYVKLLTLISVISSMVLFLYTENFILNSYIYGLGNLSRPIQSVSGFIGCNLNMSVVGYLFLYLLFKIFALTTSGAVLALIAVNTKNIVSFYGISSVIFITEGLAYVKIHPLSVYSIFRYINLISFTKVNEIFCNYKNINFFEYPVPLIQTSTGAGVVIILICGILSAYLYAEKRNLEFKKVSFRFKVTGSKKIHSLYYYNLYKSLVMQKGIVIIAAFIAITGFVNQNFYKKYDVADVYYRYYTELLDGEITQETIDFCENESQKFDDIQHRIDELSQSNPYSTELNELYRQLAPSMGFYPVRERIEMIKNIDNTQLFYDTGYKRISGIAGYDDDMKYALIAMLMCTFLISPLIANDNKYRMQYVVNSTSSGKKSYVRRNVFTTVFYGFSASLLWIVPYLITIKRYYGNGGLSASVRSITDFIDFPLNIKLWQYILIILLLRTFAVIFISLVMLYVSAKCNSIISAVLVNIALFVLPVIIYLLGADFAVNIMFNPLLSVNIILNNPSVLHFAVPSALIILSVINNKLKRIC